MADEPKPIFTEQIPSIKDGNSGVASANAPIIYADEFPVSGYYNGIAHISCEALRFHGLGSAGIAVDRVTVAHLRMNLAALAALKGAIAQIETIMARAGVSLPSSQEPRRPAE